MLAFVGVLVQSQIALHKLHFNLTREESSSTDYVVKLIIFSIVVYLYLFVIICMLPCHDGEIKLYI